MRAAVLIVCAAGALFSAQDNDPSPALARRLKLAVSETARTETGRRLEALAGSVPVVERPSPGRAFRWLRAEGKFAVDPVRGPSSSPLELELALVRERARASSGLPIELVEEEFAAQQTVLQYALEKADADPAFARSLKGACREGRALLRSRMELLASWKRAGPSEESSLDLFPGAFPKDALGWLGYALAVFAYEPQLFYAAAEAQARFSPGAVRLVEVEDFLLLHSARMDSVDCSAEGPYCRVDGRLYPARVARAASAAKNQEGLARLREGLGPFSASGMKALRGRARDWLEE